MEEFLWWVDWVDLVEQARSGDPEPLVQKVRMLHEIKQDNGARLKFADLPPVVQGYLVEQELTRPGRRGRRGYSDWFRTHVRIEYRQILRLVRLSRRVGITISFHDRRGNRYEIRPGAHEKSNDVALRLLAADLCRSPETIRDIIYPRRPKKPQPKG